MRSCRLALSLWLIAALSSGCFPDIWTWEADLDDGLDYFQDEGLQIECTRPDPLEIELGYGELFFMPMPEDHVFEVIFGLQGGTHVFAGLKILNPEVEHPMVEVLFELLDDDACQEIDEGDSEPTRYDTLLITDFSLDELVTGSAGADICGVVVECEGTVINPSTPPTYMPGPGIICGRESSDPAAEDGCADGVRRNDPAAALDDGLACDLVEPDPNHDDMRSTYVSLGLSGTLELTYDRDLRGCTVTVVEHDGMVPESYTVSVCSADHDSASDGVGCLEEESLGRILRGPTTTEIPGNQQTLVESVRADDDPMCPPRRTGMRHGLTNARDDLNSAGEMEQTGVLVFHTEMGYGGGDADRIRLTVRDQCDRTAQVERRISER